MCVNPLKNPMSGLGLAGALLGGKKDKQRPTTGTSQQGTVTPIPQGGF